MIVVLLILAVALAVIVGFFVCWSLAIAKLVRGQPLLASEPRRPVPWGLVDLVVAVLVFILAVMVYSLGAAAIRSQPALQQNMLVMLANGAMNVATMLVVIPLIMLRTGCTWRDFGVVPKEAGRDICIGLTAFCMLAPIVYAMQAALTLLQPYKHPLIEMLTKTPDLQLFAMLAFSAVILAPLFEEWAFRVLLQGWLEKTVTYTGDPLHILVGGVAPAEPMVLESGDLLQPAEGITFLPSVPRKPAEIQRIDFANPYAPPQSTLPPLASAYGSPLTAGVVSEFIPPPLWKQWLPIVVSSLIFALMHYSHGLAWIPLTLLAVGLGYIYQRTHRILPSIIVHFCLNGFSMALFWVQMFEAPHLQPK